jgi:hypothetical protein
LAVPWAIVAITAGGGCMLGAIAVAIRYHVYRLPEYDQTTGELLTPVKTAALYLTLGGAGAFFLVLGILVLRWQFG